MTTISRSDMSDIIFSATDPTDIETVETGFFRHKERKGAPWQPLRIMRESGAWVALLCGEVVPGSGARLAKEVPFLLWRSPFYRISEQEYDALLRAYAAAPPGHPLRTPGDKVDLRAAPPLYRGKPS
jgi:hypothetical protein